MARRLTSRCCASCAWRAAGGRGRGPGERERRARAARLGSSAPGVEGVHAWPLLAVTDAASGGLLVLAWVAFKVGALSYRGGFVTIPLMQKDDEDSDIELAHGTSCGRRPLGRAEKDSGAGERTRRGRGTQVGQSQALIPKVKR
jgi:hypothetical protein